MFFQSKTSARIFLETIHCKNFFPSNKESDKTYLLRNNKSLNYLKESTDFITVIKKTKVTLDTIVILVSMDVISLCMNIPKRKESE